MANRAYIRILISGLVWVLTQLSTSALAQVQTYGLQIGLIAGQNNSAFLTDYADGTAGFQITVLLRDANRAQYDFALKMRLSVIGGPTVMESRPFYHNGPHSVFSTAPLIISGPEVAELFNPRNLAVTFPEPIFQQEFLTTGMLPAGRYMLEVWAIDPTRTGQRVSNTASLILTTTLSDPPQWQIPQMNEVVTASDPQNVLFSWSPSHGVGAANVVDTRYTFRIWEMVDPGLDPNYVTLSTQPLDELIGLLSPQLVYNQFNTPLIPGMRYAVQVQAVDIMGRPVFSNEGRSEVRVFQYGRECTAATDFNFDSYSPDVADIEWQPGETNNRFQLKFRMADQPNAAWFTTNANGSKVHLSQLKPDTEYEYQVFPFCGSIAAPPSEILKFRTAAIAKSPNPEVVLECGVNTPADTISNKEPLTNLQVGDEIYVGKFNVLVTEVSGGNGTYSGSGSVAIPWLYARIGVTFEDIKINTDYRVYEGKLYGEGTDMNTLPSEVRDRVVDQVVAYEDERFCPPEAVAGDGPLFGDTETLDTLSGGAQVPVQHAGDTVALLVINGDTTLLNLSDSLVLLPGTRVQVLSSAGTADGQVVVQNNYIVSAEGVTVKVNPNNGGGANGEVPTLLLEALPNLLPDIIKSLVLPKFPQIDTHRTQVEELSQQIVTLLSDNPSIDYGDGWEQKDFLGEGLSKRITVREWEPAPGQQAEEVFVYMKHRRAYVEDQDLQYKTHYTEIGMPYLVQEDTGYNMIAEDDPRVIQLLDQIQARLSDAYTTQELDSMAQPGMIRYTRNALRDLVDGIFTEEAQQQIVQSMGWFSPNPDGQGLYAMAGDELFFGEQYRLIGQHAIDNLWDNEPPVALTPPERIALLHYILQEDPYNHLVNSVDPGAETLLPIGISKRIEDKEYLLAMTDMVFSPDGAQMNVYLSLDVPGGIKRVAFSMEGVGFNPGGLEGGQETRLRLLMDVPVFLSPQVRFWLRGAAGNTWVDFDCAGFAGFGLEGSFEFCDQLLIKEGPNGQPIEDEYVNAFFSFTSQEGWSSTVIGVNVDRFQPKDLKGWSFEIQDAYMDMSDVSNPDGFQFPAEYVSGGMVPSNPNLWRGLYVKKLQVWMPPEFTPQDTTSRITIAAQNMLIDDKGFTGLISADNLIPLDQGNLEGWAFSLDHVEMEFVANSLTAGGLRGQIVLPIAEGTPLGYGAHVDLGFGGAPPEYTFLVEVKNQLDVPMFGVAKLALLKGSQITLNSTVVEGRRKFVPSANLNGRLTMTASTSGGTEAALPSLTFQGLCLNCNGKKLSIQAIAYGNGRKQGEFGKFPISISGLEIKFPGDSIGLDFTVAVNLAPPGEGGFGGSADLSVWAKEVPNSPRIRYEFSEVKLTGFGVFMKIDPVEISGRFKYFENHSVYGKGFSGNVSGGLADIGGLDMSVVFGNINGNRYWYADVLVEFPPAMAVVIPNTPIEINGIAGGAYRHMRQAGPDDASVGNIGQSKSGIVYVPDENIGLGLKSGFMISSPAAPDLYTAETTFELTFNSHGGLNMMQLRGNMEVMPLPIDIDLGMLSGMAAKLGGGGDAVEGPPSSSSAPIYGSMVLTYDFQNHVFHGGSDVYMNYFGIIKGRGPGGRAGWTSLYFEDASNWHLLAGTPNDPWGLNVLGIQSRFYFMSGTDIPMPNPPPPQVAQELGLDLTSERSGMQLGSGKGLAIGGGMGVNTGDLNFLMFYGNFAAEVGFDLMMYHYPNRSCAGSTEPVGMNGWFASGQAYAFVVGKIGIKVDLPTIKGDFHIIDVGAAALLEAQMPNPVWVRGNVGGRYSILGGLVSGECNFRMEYGERCQMQNNGPGNGALSNIDLIAGLTPADKSDEVDVFTSPQAVFNMPVNRAFNLKDMAGVTHRYRIKLDYFRIMNGANRIAAQQEWNEDLTVVALNPVEFMPALTELRVEAKIIFQEWKNGVWEAVIFEGEPLTEAKSYTFTTGPQPDYIVEQRVEYTYPLREMVNFHRDEWGNGFIQLNADQGYLFNHSPDWQQVAKFTPEGGGASLYTQVYWQPQNKRVFFAIPAALQLDTRYDLELRDMPRSSPELVDANVQTVTESDEESGMDITTQQVTGTLERDQEQLLYELTFRTSKYATLAQKIEARQITSVQSKSLYRRNYLAQNFTLDEYFEEREILGNASIDPLVRWEASTTNNRYYDNVMYPLVYDDYPNYYFDILYRDLDELGLPPVRAMYLAGEPWVTLDGAMPGYTYNIELQYSMPLVFYRDFNDLYQQIFRSKAVADSRTRRTNSAITSSIGIAESEDPTIQPVTARAQRILDGKLPPEITFGSYPVTIKYYIPGRVSPVSTKTIVITWSAM